MLSKISFRFAINAMLIILGLVVVFHVLVLNNIIPYTIVWGGKMKNEAQMRAFESVSIMINTFMMLIIAIRGQYLGSRVPAKLLHVLLWFFVLIFTVNTVGNLFAEKATERIVFTPLTLVLAILSYRIVREKENAVVAGNDTDPA